MLKSLLNFIKIKISTNSQFNVFFRKDSSSTDAISSLDGTQFLIFLYPVDLSSFSIPCSIKNSDIYTLFRSLPGGIFNEVSLTSVAFSPKIDLNNFSSGD